MYIDYDPVNLDCILKELLYFCNCSIEIIDGKYCVIDDGAGSMASFDSYFGCIKFILKFAANNFDVITKGVDLNANK